jgi:hypothetical protein
LRVQQELGQDQGKIIALQAELQAQSQRISTLNGQKTALGENVKVDDTIKNLVEADVAKLQREYEKAMEAGNFTEALKIKEEAVQEIKQLQLAN